MIDLFVQAANRTPSHAAVRSGQAHVSYGELARLVRRYASIFAEHPAPRILIALPRGADAYACMLAAGMAGGYYTPLNVDSPIDRLRRIASLLEPDVIVADHQLAATLAQAAPAASVLGQAALDQGDLPQVERPRHEIAYVMFTSGSTGEPKGVVIPRAGLDHYVHWIRQSGTIVADDVVSQFNNLAFDFSVLDIYGALCAGATLVPIAGRGDRMMPARIIAREAITVWSSVPSVIELMRAAGQLHEHNLRSVRLFTLIGEPLTRGHLTAIFAACPAATVQNAYGPTEATVSVSRVVLTADRHEHACLGEAVTIGPAIGGMALWLEGGPHADIGEIMIAGPQVALGYWRDPARSAEMFGTAMAGNGCVRTYRTGDWAERHNGRLFFRGRIDLQIKLRGYRIELNEIAGAFGACGWPSVCVFPHAGELVALVECPPGKPFDEAHLRQALSRRLESHCVPAHIVACPSLPRNENDKLDQRRAVALFEAARA